MKFTYIKYLLLGLFWGCSTISFAQSEEGFWDNVRNTNETIILDAGKRKILKTADFPVGTTEVVYRMSVLDDNQKLSSSLVSILKSIPDPSGISQGAAGTVFLLSAITGEDKCKFYVFTNENDALQYEKTGVLKNACASQDEPVSKSAKLLTEKSRCIPQGAQNLWFGFESGNWLMKAKVVLEVVPWVDYNLRKGWTVEGKKEVLALASKLEVVNYLTKKDQFYGLFLENIMDKFKYPYFKQLLPAEKNRAIEIATEASLTKTGEIDKWCQVVCDKAAKLFKDGKTTEAIDLIQSEMVAKNRQNYRGYGILGDYYLLSKQYSKAEEAYQKGLELNPAEIIFYLDLAHVYMFTDRLSEAKEIHKKYQSQNLSTEKPWKEQVRIDFLNFQKRGLPTKNFKKILRVLD
ncbi:tetratricopeptide repeat protein [Flavobacterium terrisoli]|uniref:tetratricopeptide repeat protein n=1 Tax=Flavobacterium terrisoli TaxID=3242195 RepID=UPI002542A92B|nr:tetratricopeptide repeat protein [Flavobacterium buctense]